MTPPTGCPWSDDPGDSYLELTLEFGGVPWDICDGDMVQPLEILPAAPGSDGLLHLREAPDPQSLIVHHLRGDGTTVLLEPGEWTFDTVANAVQVDPLAGSGPDDTIRVSYTPLDPT